MRTIKGDIDESMLRKETIYSEVNGNKLLRTEYYLDGELVRSDLTITPTQLRVFGSQGAING